MKKIWALLTATLCTVSPVAAFTPPPINSHDRPEGAVASIYPLKQEKQCITLGVLPGKSHRVNSYSKLFNYQAIHKITTGRHTTIAVLSTGVNPSPHRITTIGGGDIIPGDNGLKDCDSTGTIQASLIAAKPSSKDPVVGIAPGSRIYSIRVYSNAYREDVPYSENTDNSESDSQQNKVLERKVLTLAQAIVFAANQGAKIILTPSYCYSSYKPININPLGAAVDYAVREKKSLIISPATTSDNTCQANPDINYADPKDTRNWKNTTNIVVPAVYADEVVSVNLADTTGKPIGAIAGPWTTLLAPGNDVQALNNNKFVNATPGDKTLQPLESIDYATAIVAGEAALIAAQHPRFTPTQIRTRLIETAHHTGLTNTSGYGFIDPLAAISSQLPVGKPEPVFTVQEIAKPLPPPAPASNLPKLICLISLLATLVTLTIVVGYKKLIK